MKFKSKMTNSVDAPNRCRVSLSHLPNRTTNSSISEKMFKRECEEYDKGTLIVHRDLYIGERA